MIETGFTPSKTIKPIKAIPKPNHLNRLDTAWKNNTPTIVVHSGVVAFSTDAILLVNLVSLNAINAQGMAVLTKAIMAIGIQEIFRNSKGFRKTSIIIMIATNPKEDLKKEIVQGPKS
jgi:hypothetical protein